MEKKTKEIPKLGKLNSPSEPEKEMRCSSFFTDNVDFEAESVSVKLADGTRKLVYLNGAPVNSMSSGQEAELGEGPSASVTGVSSGQVVGLRGGPPVNGTSNGQVAGLGKGAPVNGTSSGQVAGLGKGTPVSGSSSGQVARIGDRPSALLNGMSSGPVSESGEGKGNQGMDGLVKCGRSEESSSEDSDSEIYEEGEELYGAATGMGLDPSTLMAQPDLKDVMYEISCINCAMPVGPPTISCAYGHLICGYCFEELEDKTVCKTMVGDAEKATACTGRYYEINETILNTPYFKYFLEVSQYACFAAGLGCKVLSSGNDVYLHEGRQCPYRFVKYCGYRSGVQSCDETFGGWASHLKHMIETHNIPVYLTAEGHFLVKYDRDEFKNKNTDDDEIDVIPLVRAVQGEENKDFLIVLMAKELENDKTRVWFLDARADSGTEVDKRYVAFMSIHPVQEGYDWNDKDWILKCIDNELAVIPQISMLTNLENNPKDEDGLDYFLDIDNEVLNGLAVVKDGQKYFAVMTKISEKKRVDLPTTSEASTIERAEGIGVEVMGNGNEVIGRNGSAEAKNCVDDGMMENGRED